MWCGLRTNRRSVSSRARPSALGEELARGRRQFPEENLLCHDTLVTCPYFISSLLRSNVVLYTSVSVSLCPRGFTLLLSFPQKDKSNLKQLSQVSSKEKSFETSFLVLYSGSVDCTHCGGYPHEMLPSTRSWAAHHRYSRVKYSDLSRDYPETWLYGPH